MPRSRQATRQRILTAAYELFWRMGFARVSVDTISAAAGITKRTFYSHFESKDLLLAEVMGAQGDLALQTFKTFTKGLSGTPEAIVAALFNNLQAWSAEPQWKGSGYTRLVVELADLPGHPARKIAKDHKVAQEALLAEVLTRAGVADGPGCARGLWVLLEGAMILRLIHGEAGHIGVAAEIGHKFLTNSVH